MGHVPYPPFTSLPDTGELYVWGRNKHGQLASLAAFLPLPQRVEAHYFQDEKVTAVWSGWTHLVAKTGEGAAEHLGLVRVAVHSLVLGVGDKGGRGRDFKHWDTEDLASPSVISFSSMDYSFALGNTRLHW